MTSAKPADGLNETIDSLGETLEQVWQRVCCTYDAMGDLPNPQIIFDGVELSKPFQAAKKVLANMLLEAMDNIGRFSPWYTRPARAFGLASLYDHARGKNVWILAPESVQKWQDTLENLSEAIDQNYTVIQAMLYVENLMEDASPEDPLVVAHCGCVPPRTIRLTQSVLIKAEILCEACAQPFA